MKKRFGIIAGIVIITSFMSVCQCFAKLGGQVFFRGSYAQLSVDRGDDALMSPNDKDGWGVGAGLHLPIAIDPFFKNDILGEIMLSYYSFSNDVGVDEKQNAVFTALIGPRYRIHLAEPGTPLSRLQPFVGVGMLFGVISPPSNDVSYLDIGVQPSIGIDYTLPCTDDSISLGIDYRYSFFAHDVGRNEDFQNVGVYLGINF
ncbi:MAG: hypothetical protein HYV59_08900 [Planctomycetes bacterium]|nr:hypothetical protein [Planctomycetota bacterium]